VAFSFKYGMDIMQATGMDTKVIRAGHANMFLSPIFRTTLATVADAVIELYETDGSVGAATGAALGSGYYATAEEAFRPLHKIEVVTPDRSHHEAYLEAYVRWEDVLRREFNA
jgi:xylulokinase